MITEPFTVNDSIRPTGSWELGFTVVVVVVVVGLTVVVVVVGLTVVVVVVVVEPPRSIVR